MRDPVIKKLLSESTAIFYECFTPIKDPSTNRDLIPFKVNSQNMTDQGVARMYTPVLTVNSEVVSVVVFRVFGRKIADFLQWMHCLAVTGLVLEGIKSL